MKKLKNLGLENNLETFNQLRAFFNKKDYNELFYFFGKGSTIEVLSYEADKNELPNLSQDSYMGMKLNIGKNVFSLVNDGGIFSARIKYRQKYLGV